MLGVGGWGGGGGAGLRSRPGCHTPVIGPAMLGSIIPVPAAVPRISLAPPLLSYLVPFKFTGFF